MAQENIGASSPFSVMCKARCMGRNQMLVLKKNKKRLFD